jgi:hypothetical protein
MTMVVSEIASSRAEVRRQILADGLVLELNRAVVDSRIEFVHGNLAQKLLGNVIPAKGIHIYKFNLSRPSRRNLDSVDAGKTWLMAEFKLSGPNATNSALARPDFFRQFRCVLYGEKGIEYVGEWDRNEFQIYPDGCFGTVLTSRFPRDTRRLGFRIQKRQQQDQGGPWETVADFKIKNPSRPVIQSWSPDSITKSVDGLDFSIGEITVKTQDFSARDIWNHVVTLPIEVRSNGAALTNWTTGYINARDASGNWDMFASHRSLDPRYVWKMETDFEPSSDFSDDSVATVTVPVSLPAPLVTNIAGVPVTLSWGNRYFLSAQIPTNRTDLAIRFVSARDENGGELNNGSASWNRFGFWQGMGFSPPVKGRYVQATIAIVPNVHLTFYRQPRLIAPEAGAP